MSAGFAHVMMETPFSTLNVWVTGVAAAKLALPGWFAVIEQTPTETSVTLDPATVQTGVELLP